MNQFAERHIGPRQNEVKQMLEAVGVSSIDELITQTVPANILLDKPLVLPKAIGKSELLDYMKSIGKKNKNYRSYIGLGYYNTVLPGVIQRNILENPGWYTAYIYQAEIAQGRLEALLNYQTMVTDLTGMEISNASLLDEATAAAEAMILLYNARSRGKKKADANIFLCFRGLFSQTIDVLKSRAIPIGINLMVTKHTDFKFSDEVFGCLLQYPSKYGEIYDYQRFSC